MRYPHADIIGVRMADPTFVVNPTQRRHSNIALWQLWFNIKLQFENGKLRESEGRKVNGLPGESPTTAGLPSNAH